MTVPPDPRARAPVTGPDAERWRAASELLGETLELSDPARKELLDRACAGRDDLRRDVEALLAAETRTGVLDRPVAEYAARLLSSPSTSLAGRRLSHFLVGERIGAGGMGVVHRAIDEPLRREVALKFLPESALQDPVSRERLLREARAASALNHVGIVTIHEVGSAEGIDFIAMELVDGEPLSRRIPKKGLPIATVLSFGGQIASALAVAHEKGILHRDLKPANLLVTRDERVKVLDFGLAKPLGQETSAPGATEPGPPSGRSDPDAALTEAGARVGTPQYMSPEQAWGLPLDARSDVFSLGVVLHEMLTGEAPFRRRNATEAMAAIRQDEAPPVERVRPDVPPALAALVRRSLSKDPAGRPPTMRALLDELSRVERGLSRPRRVRTRIAATVVASIAAAGIFHLARETRRPEAPLPFELLSTFPGSHRQPSLSPDGRSIAFVQADGQGVPQLWTRPLGDGIPRKLTDDPHGVSHPRWSPRGVIVYAVRRQGIWAVPEAGGAPRRLVSSGVSPNLSRDGERLVYQRRTRLLVARSDGSGEIEIPGVRLRFRFGAAAPAFSPDGREVVYFQDSDAPMIGDLSIVRVEGGAPRPLTKDGVYVADPVFTPDGKRILFSSERAGPLTLWEMDAAGGEPRALTSGSGEDSEADVSADGLRLVYANRKTTYLLRALEPATGARRIVLERRHMVTHPSFSPDGAQLTYFTQEGRTFRVFASRADGSGERQLEVDPREGYVLPAWSRDGRSIALYRMWPKPLFVRLDLSSSRVETVATDFPNDRHLGADVDVTNRFLVYPAIADDSRRTVVREIATGTEHDLAEPILWPRFAPDGASIAGGALDGSLKRCPPTGEPCGTLSRVGQDPAWSRGWVYFVRHGDVYGDADVQVVEVRRVRPDGTGEEHVADLPGAHPINFFYTVSPSSGEVVWSEYHPSPSELWTAVLPHRP